jgi:hypothetical protein
MSGYGITYSPPSENLPIFDTSVFVNPNTETLTIADGLDYFLAFPNAQGTENLLAINVAGVATFTASANTDNSFVFGTPTGTDPNATTTTIQQIYTGSTQPKYLQFLSSIAGGGLRFSDPTLNAYTLTANGTGMEINKGLTIGALSNGNSVGLIANGTNNYQLDISGNISVQAILQGNQTSILNFPASLPTTNSGNYSGMGICWNGTGGGGETDFICYGQGGVGGLNIYSSNYKTIPTLIASFVPDSIVFESYPTINLAVLPDTTSNSQIATTAFVHSVVNNIPALTGVAILADSQDPASFQQFTGYNNFTLGIQLGNDVVYQNTTRSDFKLNNANTSTTKTIQLALNGDGLVSTSTTSTQIKSYDAATLAYQNISSFTSTGLDIVGSYGLTLRTQATGQQNSGVWGFQPQWNAGDNTYPPHFNFVTPNQKINNNSCQYNFQIWNGTGYTIAVAINAGGIEYVGAAQVSSIVSGVANVATSQVNSNGDYEISVTDENNGGDVVINGTSWRQTLGDLSQAKQDLQTAQQNITELQVKMNYLYQTFFHI